MSEAATKAVLIVDGSPKSRKRSSRAVAATGAKTIGVKNVAEAVTALDRERFDLLVVDWENVQAAEHAARLGHGTQVILVTHRPVFERFGPDMMGMPMASMIVSNVVARNDLDDPIATRELVTTVAKLFTSDIFGLEKYFNWGAAIHHSTLQRSTQRAQVIDEVSTYAVRIGMAERDLPKLGLLVDELLMNAIWDAPVDTCGVSKYNTISRATPIDLLPEEIVDICYGSDGNVFGLSVSDRFGRLERDLAVDYIQKCFSRGAQSISFGDGGSGLGLYMAYSVGSSFVLNVDPGTRTEVIGLIRLTQPPEAKEFLDICRSLCYFRRRTSPGLNGRTPG